MISKFKGEREGAAQKTNSRFLRTALIFVFVLKFFLPIRTSEWPALSAQNKTKAAQESLQHEVTVIVKLVQVFVIDSKGNPARDLETSDFILYDNGKLQSITGFEKHFLAAHEAKAAAGKLEETKLAPPRGVSSLMNRKFIFLFDNERNDLEGMAKSRNAALQFMDDQVQPTDDIALFSYSPIRGLTLHEYFTSDHKKVREAITKIKDLPGIVRSGMESVSSEHEAMGMELLSQQVMAGHSPAPLPGGTRGFIFRLTDLAKAFRHIPGQKNIILFTKGFGRGILAPGCADREFFMTMSKELASANSPVFTIKTATTEEEKTGQPETSLEYLSKQTGGKYFDNVNYYSKIAEDIQNATSNYYVLSYSVASTWDGKFHDLKVKVKKPGYKAYAQGGYFNPLPFNELSAMEKHLHLLDLVLGEKAYFEQHLNFPMIALPFSDKKDLNTILLSEIPVQRIREAVGDNTEFISLVFDRNKTIVDSKRVEMNWGTIKGEKICQYAAASLAPGRYDCRIVIRNLDNGKAAVGACAVDIPEARAAELRIYPPLLLIPGQATQYLNISGQDKTGAAKEVSLSQVFPFPAKEFVPLTGELKQGTSSLCAALRTAWSGTQEPKIQIVAWLVQEGQEEKIPLEFSLLSTMKQEEADVLFLESEVPELQPGRYSLHILAEDSATKSSSETKSDFWVR
jgi:VWFA-related protein